MPGQSSITLEPSTQPRTSPRVTTSIATAAKCDSKTITGGMRVAARIAGTGAVVATAMLMACTWISEDPVTATSIVTSESSSVAIRPAMSATEEFAGGAALASVLFAEHAALPMVDELATLARIDARLQTADVAQVANALQSGDLDVARDAADRLIQQRVGASISHQMMGAVLMAAGEPKTARGSFERAIAIDPAFVPAIASLAQLDMQEGKTDVALARFEYALTKGSTSPALLKGYEALMRDAGLDHKTAFSRPMVLVER
jgi:hypothetical protein